MIARYTPREMGRLWTEQRKYDTWLRVEVAAAEAMADHGLIPPEAARDIRERGAVDAARVAEIEETTQHDVIAFTTAVAEHVGPSARWLHFGMTSSDVIDTAHALQMRAACDLLLADLDGLAAAVRERADEHRRTPMIGRTHGVHAEPMTFGLKLALWFTELQRDRERLVRARETIRVGKLSGAVGTYAHLDPAIERGVVRPPRADPGPGRLAGRAARPPRRAAGRAGDHRGVAREVRAGGARPAEGRRRARWPSPSPRVRRGRRRCRTSATRSAANRSRGWRAWCAPTRWPPSRTWRCGTSATSRTRRWSGSSCPTASARSTTWCAGSRGSYAASSSTPSACATISDRSRGVVFSGTVLLALASRGVSREDAYLLVQRNAMRSHDEGLEFKALLLADPEVTAVLGPREIERAFDLDVQLRHVDAIMDRALAAAAVEVS